MGRRSNAGTLAAPTPPTVHSAHPPRPAILSRAPCRALCCSPEKKCRTARVTTKMLLADRSMPPAVSPAPVLASETCPPLPWLVAHHLLPGSGHAFTRKKKQGPGKEMLTASRYACIIHNTACGSRHFTHSGGGGRQNTQAPFPVGQNAPRRCGGATRSLSTTQLTTRNIYSIRLVLWSGAIYPSHDESKTTACRGGGVSLTPTFHKPGAVRYFFPARSSRNQPRRAKKEPAPPLHRTEKLANAKSFAGLEGRAY